VAERIAPMLLNILFMNSPTLSSEGLQLFNPLHLVHHPANIGQASPSLGVGGLAAAFSLFLFGHDPLHDGGAAVFGKILSYVLFCVAETVTDHVLDHFHFLQECWRAIKTKVKAADSVTSRATMISADSFDSPCLSLQDDYNSANCESHPRRREGAVRRFISTRWMTSALFQVPLR
jgi:hypothetical protein